MRLSGYLRSPAAAAGLLAAAVYSDWIVADRLAVYKPLRQGYVSELGARGQPHAFLMNSLDAAAGATFVALALDVHRFHGTTLLRRSAAAAFGVFGVSAAIAAVFPMGFAPSVSGPEASSSWTDRVHTVASVGEFGGLVVSICLLSLALRDEPEWRRVARAGFVLGPALGALAAYVAVRAQTGHNVGTSERALILGCSAWAATVAIVVMRRAAVGPAPRALPRRTPTKALLRRLLPRT
jgi:hypothetical protein